MCVCVINGSTVLWFSKGEYLSRYPFKYYPAESLWKYLLKMWRLWFRRDWCHWLPGVRCVSSTFHCQLKWTPNLCGVHSSCLPPDIISNSFGICFRFRERERKIPLMCCWLEHCLPTSGSHSAKESHQWWRGDKEQSSVYPALPGSLVLQPNKARVPARRQHWWPMV